MVHTVKFFLFFYVQRCTYTLLDYDDLHYDGEEEETEGGDRNANHNQPTWNTNGKVINVIIGNAFTTSFQNTVAMALRIS